MKKKILHVNGIEEAFKFKNKKSLVLLQDYKFDIGLMKQFGEGNSCFLIDLSRIIDSSGFRRAIELGRMRNFLRICTKYGIRFALASFAKYEFSIRNADELCHICCLLGLNMGQAKFALQRLQEYLD
ncbi:hypothetical protein KJ780_02730 [Candidatus Micrarchaeota archaeon]|nr:hypothetical protein [Candidatus Micrarchaeota archaeon]